jgi:hypothetical protein
MLLSTITRFVLITIGFTSAYAPGVFEQVIATRQAGKTAYNIGSIPNNVDGYIAVEDCSLINSVVIACFPNGCESLLVADCAGAADGGRAWMQNMGFAGEVDPETFARHKLTGECLIMQLYLLEHSMGYAFE